MPRWLAAAVVLISAGVVLVLEILAMRLAAPYVGLTLNTYSAAIGVALLGIAAGAWTGGRLADEVDPRATLGPTLTLAGALVFLTRPIVDGLGPHVQGRGPVGTLALVAVATGPAIFVLSMAHPAVVKLRLASLDATGSTVGGLSALGTLGALGGTFLTGFVLLGELTTREITFGAGTLVVALGIVVALVLRPGRPRQSAMAVVALPAIAILLASDGICDRETRYYCARVEAVEPPARQLVLDDLHHSDVDPARPELLRFAYLQHFRALLDALRPGDQAVDALHVGGGGFAFPRYLAAARPGSSSTVLELDPGVVEIAREQLGLRPGPDMRVVTGDARMSILEEPDHAYDVVVGDAFASRSVPWHLTTREFLEEVRRVLRPDGAYVMNLIDAGDLEFLRAELATLQAVFGHAVFIAPAGQAGGNFVLVASPRPLPPAALRPRERDSHSVTDAVTVIDGAQALRDEFAPVDQLIGERAR